MILYNKMYICFVGQSKVKF